jgi:hypothetical protein
MAARVQVIDLTKKGERPTETLGNAIKSLLKWVGSYPKPFITIFKGEQVVESYLFKGKNDIAGFSEANMAAILSICVDLIPMDTMMNVGHTSDPLIMEFMKALSLVSKDAKSVSVAKMEQDLKAKAQSFKLIFRYAKAEAKDKVFIGQTPKAVLDWQEAAKAQRTAAKLLTNTATA